MGHRLLPGKPQLYHGKETSRPYFEGWYYKQAWDSQAFCIIPGIFRGKKESEDTAFIQLMYGKLLKSFFFRFPYREFNCKKNKFEVWIGSNFFSMEKILLDIAQDGVRAQAELLFSRLVLLKTTVFSPSVMGPFSYLPAMQCNHAVLSLSHYVNGSFIINENHTRLNNAVGYIEKDWGEAFPKNWIWMQCNDENNSFMCSVASISYCFLHIKGLICVLRLKDKQYRFATYNGSRVLMLKKHGHKINVVIKRGGYLLKITAYNKEFGSLKAPSKTGMNREIAESINAKFHITLTYKKTPLFSENFQNGGLEMQSANALIK